MYFAILGKHKNISLKELELAKPSNITKLQTNLISFDTKTPNILNKLAGIIKRGIIIDEKNLGDFLEGQKLIGASSIALGKKRKEEFGIKRFKITSPSKTDKLIKKKGIEIISMPQQNLFGIVKGYQNIPMYESIDFSKPSRDMEMGMMPSKLTHIMINLGLNINNNLKNITIYDPFVGSGTTGFLANELGFNFIGSDINIYHIKKNFQRWKTTKGYKLNPEFEFFEQNITKSFNENLKDNLKNQKEILIISEGRLGPIVKERTTEGQIRNFQEQVQKLYQDFFKQINNFQKNQKIPIVITTPFYINHKNLLEENLKSYTESLGRDFDSIEEIYQRPNQKIGRKILILS